MARSSKPSQVEQSKPPLAQGNNGGRFASYRYALQAISARTGTSLPSLVVSFAVLHEVTALFPLVGIFFGARALGVGEKVVDMAKGDRASDVNPSWVRVRTWEWMDEGEKWATRVGRKYGIWGLEQGKTADVANGGPPTVKIAGDVANAVVAYGLTKALLPFRIGLSLYLSPGFARGVVDPIRNSMTSMFWKRPPL